MLVDFLIDCFLAAVTLVRACLFVLMLYGPVNNFQDNHVGTLI